MDGDAQDDDTFGFGFTFSLEVEVRTGAMINMVILFIEMWPWK